MPPDGQITEMQGLPQILARIDRRLAKLKLSDNAASKKAGKPDAIRNARRALDAPNRQGITLSTLEALAGALETTVAWLADETGPEEAGDVRPPATSTDAQLRNELSQVDLGELVPVKIAGKVKAGEFIAIEDLGDWEEPEEFLDTRDPRFPHARHLGFEVEGDSMNALKPRPIQDGDRLSALAYEDIADRYPLRDGMIVVVERTRHGGHEREWSVKQLEIYEDRMEFHPRSTNPRYKPIVIKRDSLADDGVTVEIIAIVRRLVAEFNL